MIYLDENIWRKHIKGWDIVDCAVRERTIVYLCLREDLPDEELSLLWDSDIPSKHFVLNLAKSGSHFGAHTLNGYNKPVLGVARKPLPQGLLVDRGIFDGHVNMMGGGKQFPDEIIDQGNRPMTNRVKCINDYAYSVGSDRKIYKRTDIGKWEIFAELSEERHDGFDIADYGFEDMDAFSETDMYAVGGRGDVWHFDGNIWVQQGFPSNAQLGTVTCAGDGHVYISGEGGTLWRGRMSTWECIYEGNSTILWNDVLWFDNKLWLASDDETCIWNGKQMLPIIHNGEEVDIYGHMDAYTDPDGDGGLLVIASPEVVMAYDGKEWKTLVAPYQLDGGDQQEKSDEEDEE